MPPAAVWRAGQPAEDDQLMAQLPELQVVDQAERRVRRPIDALRCVMSCLWIVLLSVAGLTATATTTGAETDIVGASRHLPRALLVVAPSIALFALLIFPIALAISQFTRHQARRLIDAAAAGLLAAVVTSIVNAILTRPFAEQLYGAIIMSRSGVRHVPALDPYLAGLIAYVTIVGLTGRTAWRNALWLALGAYGVTQLVALHTSVMAFLIALLAGSAIGQAVRYGAGTISQRPSARDIAAALSSPELRLTKIRRVGTSSVGSTASRHYEVTTDSGAQLDLAVFDRDQQAAGAVYRLYRWARLQGQVSRSTPLSFERAVERQALLSYAVQDAGVPTPRLHRVVRVGSDAGVLAFEHCAGTTLAQRGPACTDEELDAVWDAVARLHARNVTHRGLTAERILFVPGGEAAPDGQVMLLDPGTGDVAASDLQKRLDLAQLIVELALAAGPDRATKLAIGKLGGSGIVGVLPLLQPVALVRSTRHELRRRKDILPAVRKALLAAVPGGEEVTPVRLERIRPRALVTMVASIAAAYLLAGELAQASLGHLLASADWLWSLAALALSAATYGAAALSLSGFVTERLNFPRTVLVQLASSFVTLVTPAAVGGAALNVRYLQRRKVPGPAAVASVAVSQVVAFALHILLLAMVAAIAGTSSSTAIRPPVWSYFVAGGLVALAGGILAFPAGRRMVRARLSPTFGQVSTRLVEIAQTPRKLAAALGGALSLNVAYILCLAACVAAFGGTVPLAKIGVVYLTGVALGSIIPTPGGLGAVEAALTAGLTAVGVPGGVAVSAVLLFRLLTFWLPVPVGLVAMNYLQRRHEL
jgi:uncharacterized membrane protein YbhN (UPF0104 family)/tRNA A-37 threonylcarbamoyl transferase component Bud32